MNRQTAINKLLKYIEENYRFEDVRWGTDQETELSYTCRIVAKGIERLVWINKFNGEIIDKEEKWLRSKDKTYVENKAEPMPEDWTLKELRAYCKEYKVKGYTRMSHLQLIKAVEKIQQSEYELKGA